MNDYIKFREEFEVKNKSLSFHEYYKKLREELRNVKQSKWACAETRVREV